jgi:hypothetical protein
VGKEVMREAKQIERVATAEMVEATTFSVLTTE